MTIIKLAINVTAVLNVTLIITNFSLTISAEICQYGENLKNNSLESGTRSIVFMSKAVRKKRCSNDQ